MRKKNIHSPKVEIKNNIPNVQVGVEHSSDGDIVITLTSASKTTETIGNIPLGGVVKIGKREYIVLDHSKDTTAIISKDIVTTMAFGTSGGYANSEIRKYCNNDFYNEIINEVGIKNVIKHTVSLVCDDGTNKGENCQDYISVLTTEKYRRYREFLPAAGKPWWTAAQVTRTVDGYNRYVCCVNSSGVLVWNDWVCACGVRPFCILKSSVLVSQ